MVVRNEPRMQSVRVAAAEVIADLVDDRMIRVPLACLWQLAETPTNEAYRNELPTDASGAEQVAAADRAESAIPACRRGR